MSVDVCVYVATRVLTCGSLELATFLFEKGLFLGPALTY